MRTACAVCHVAVVEAKPQRIGWNGASKLRIHSQSTSHCRSCREFFHISFRIGFAKGNHEHVAGINGLTARRQGNSGKAVGIRSKSEFYGRSSITAVSPQRIIIYVQPKSRYAVHTDRAIRSRGDFRQNSHAEVRSFRNSRSHRRKHGEGPCLGRNQQVGPSTVIPCTIRFCHLITFVAF